MRFSANLSFLYQELQFLERFAAAAKDGFRAVEYMDPYGQPPHVIAQALEQNGLTQALFNLPSGDWAAGERGIACLPDRIEEFRAGVVLALDYAMALKCSRLNVLAGIMPEEASPESLEQTLVANLQYAAPLCQERGVQLLIEPINRRDIPNFFLTHLHDADRILRRVRHPNLFIQFDAYHVQVTEGDLAMRFADRIDHIAHVQIADNPGRHEPGTGEINFGYLLSEMARLGYGGWIGCEYRPVGNTRDGLGWMKSFRQGDAN